MTIRRARQRAAEDLRQELISVLGWQATTDLIHREAETLRVDPTSSTAIRNAYAVHQSNRNQPAQTQPEQEQLI